MLRAKITLPPLDKSEPDPIIHIRIWTWVGQSYRHHESEQKFHTTHSRVHLTSNELELLVAAWRSSLWLYMCLCLQMNNELIWGYWVCHATFAFQGWWGGRVLPSSVMMGMLDPVVTEAWRTKPCTGLLSGDDLSIPGGVKPGHIHENNRFIEISI